MESYLISYWHKHPFGSAYTQAERGANERNRTFRQFDVILFGKSSFTAWDMSYYISKDPDYELVFELWDVLSDEALISFEDKLENKLLNYRLW